jgi:hypothetical protein
MDRGSTPEDAAGWMKFGHKFRHPTLAINPNDSLSTD